VHSSNDMSGSMSDTCNDGRSKMQHLHLTLDNIVQLLSKNADNVDVTLEITGFDNEVEEILEPTKIQQNLEQVNQIQAKIKNILKPRGATNIILALRDAKEKISKYTNSKNFIFMTDGNITAGTNDIEYLSSEVPENSHNYFVGFGADHDFKLLQSLAAIHSGSYYYVDKIENAGLVFGEIIHSILYAAFKNVTISVTNGEIYDFEKNAWTTELKIPLLCGEAKKQYHVRSQTPDIFEISYSGYNIFTGRNYKNVQSALPDLINENDVMEVRDFRKYIYRQKTLELLAEVVKTVRNAMESHKNPKLAILKKLKTKLTDFRKKLEEFAAESTSEEDKDYIKQLCDDLYMSERTIYSERALLYTTARQMSQGRGGSHNVTNIEQEDINDDYDDEEDDNCQHNAKYIMSAFSMNRANTSATQAKIMQDCSQTYRM